MTCRGGSRRRRVHQGRRGKEGRWQLWRQWNAPDFAWIGQYSEDDYVYAEGWEASAVIAPGSYLEFNCHTQVFDGGEPQTSAVANRAITLVIECEEVPPPVPAVSVWAMIAGVLTVGAVATILRRRRVAITR